MYEQATAYFCGDELSAAVYIDKYALRDPSGEKVLEPTPDEMHWRIANELARVEAKKFKRPFTAKFIHALLKDFKYIIPQGSPMFGIGNPQYATLSNCYVLHPPEDSYGGIHRTDEELTQICKRRGGVGIDLSNLRPALSPTTNSARTSTGIVPFMERYSNSIREVGQNGRRGALMLTISVHHPQVLDFARAKTDKKKVTGANISVRLTDEFLTAVREDTDYEQRWPVTGTPKISRRVSARSVWRELTRLARDTAEPGLLFWDNIIKESPADCYSKLGFETICVNPCAELPLCILDSCRLLLLNLFSFVEKPFTKYARFNWSKYCRYARVAQRLMDDIIDLELEAIERILKKIDSDPEPEEVKARERTIWKQIKEKCENGRRTGTGLTAVGDTLAALGVRYGSDESIEKVEAIYCALKHECYRESVNMAKELGAFPIWDPTLEKDCPFLLRIRDEDKALWENMQKYGRRNIAILTTAPAGSVSIEAGPRPYFQTTSGIEPLFAMWFTRRKKINASDLESRVDFTDDLGDRWQEYRVYHPKLRMWMDVTGETDPQKSPYAGCCAEDLDWRQRVRLQAAAQRHIDHAISSTINLPEDVTEEQVAEIYEEAWLQKCKGMTVYRKNCRTGVLVNGSAKPEGIKKTNAPKRPKDLPCDIHFTKVGGDDHFVFVGLLEEEPYEVIAGLNRVKGGHVEGRGGADLGHSGNQKGRMVREKRGLYHYCSVEKNGPGEPIILYDVADYCSDEQEALTRIISTALRHGTPVEFLVHQLEKVRGDMMGLAKALARILKKYVKDGTKVSGEACESCGEETLVRQEGCATCKTCGASKCS